ncbi:hypothetical protein AZE42_07942 [Rhizopogon vesiculosus]|uniref:Uncharacterized protein n=1 Tax=Rhizopogon vesiculosus TaxID=180088 RepID=A0A1J8R3E4_9AGAM|nr:hypothetical protein AZE42_07942 [Rhizopogon vesiculosus]
MKRTENNLTLDQRSTSISPDSRDLMLPCTGGDSNLKLAVSPKDTVKEVKSNTVGFILYTSVDGCDIPDAVINLLDVMLAHQMANTRALEVQWIHSMLTQKRFLLPPHRVLFSVDCHWVLPDDTPLLHAISKPADFRVEWEHESRESTAPRASSLLVNSSPNHMLTMTQGPHASGSRAWLFGEFAIRYVEVFTEYDL